MDGASVDGRRERQVYGMAAGCEPLTRFDSYVDVALPSAGEGFCGC